MANTTIHKDGSVTIELSPDEAAWLGDALREWDEMGHWTKREDCKNWKRSPIARENRRESIVFQGYSDFEVVSPAVHLFLTSDSGVVGA